MLNDTLVIHGGEIVPGSVASSMAGMDLTPILNLFPPSTYITCASLNGLVNLIDDFTWAPEWHRCTTAVGPVKGHALATYQDPRRPERNHTLLAHGGLSSGSFDQVQSYAMRADLVCLVPFSGVSKALSSCVSHTTGCLAGEQNPGRLQA
jgi:hypothetical protein